MPVDDVAREGFSADAARYDRARPGYPRDAVAWLAESLRLTPGARVLDLAAGTGKLTRLLPDGLRLTAVDALLPMIEEMRTSAVRCAAAVALADGLPVRDATFDAITCGQAFHWFDDDATIRELRRALRPSGRLGLVWYSWDERDPLTVAIRDLIVTPDAAPSWQKLHLTRGWQEAVFADRADFTPLTAATFGYVQHLDGASVVERLLSASHVARRSREARAAFADHARTVLATHPLLAGRASYPVALRADCFWTEAR